MSPLWLVIMVHVWGVKISVRRHLIPHNIICVKFIAYGERVVNKHFDVQSNQDFKFTL